ncbi:MAGUK p55 subfamily member 4 isoform X2 [Gadus macrocephalus]|uniref:MAGUK p55 subfamily member 4 isoform X2 n=1 Tax=Gadus macrocephalus TaxID=80720 RepID=UPI0028CB7B3A|nr:MAGUK p55 subfamily member 4 isoform X2 [Gadus macrocephalus]
MTTLRPSMEDRGKMLTSVVEEIRRAVTRNISGAQLLHTLLRAPWLYGLLKVYDCLLDFKIMDHRPTFPDASGLAYQIMDDLKTVQCSDEGRELYKILQSPHIQALLSSHDSIARLDYEPVLPPLPEELPGDQDAMRIVCLVKNNQPLGATIKRDEETGEIYIARVIHGGLADRSGLLHTGDLLLEVNGNPVEGLEPEQVIQILIHSQGTILFKVIPNKPQTTATNSSVFMRAMVDYSPQQDWSLPCPDVGMSFRKGQLLEVVDQTDGHWWQARRLPTTSSCAGLIPSTSMLKSKQREQWWSQPLPIDTCIRQGVSRPVDEKADEEPLNNDEAESDVINGLYLAGFRRSLRLWRRMAYRGCRLSCSSCYSCSPHSTSLSNPYEEVVLYQRSPQENPRLIVLVGTSGVGVNELRKNLIRMKPSLFKGPIPRLYSLPTLYHGPLYHLYTLRITCCVCVSLDTTRPMREGEQTGREYHFVTRELFEYMVCNNRFLEYGLCRGHLYGTSSDAIREVLRKGRICIIDAEPHSLHALRSRKLKPYVIFIRPPERDVLRLTRQHARILTSCCSCRAYTEEDYEELEEASGLMEMKYRQLFDRTVENGRLEEATAELLSVIQEAQEEEQWVPAPWSVPEESRREERRDKGIREERRGGLTYTMDYTSDVY